MNMRNIVENNYGKVTVVERSDYKWGVIDDKGNEIVPFGKYDWIEGFEQGLCRVKIGKHSSYLANNDNKWGIINEKGEEVLPCEYDEVWRFLGKNRFSTRVIEDGVARDVYFQDINPSLTKPEETSDDYSYDDYDEYDEYEDYDDVEPRTYDEYNGTYVQDVEGWSDQDINDVLDGDPDAYWNID